MSFMNRWALPFMVALSLGAGSILAQQGPATMGGSTSIGTGVLKFGSPVDAGISRTGASTIAVGNGTAGNASGTVTASTFNASSSINSGNALVFGSNATFRVVGVGLFKFLNFAETLGAEVKVDALPTVSACGAGSPTVVAGSTPMSGAVTIGTTAVATCTITFNGTAYAAAPHCSGSVETTTPANARAMGYSTSATVLTIVPSAAWADSSVVNWTCFSPM